MHQQKVGAGRCEHRVQVTRIGDGYNRLFIQPEARDMLRWEDKMGNYSDYADAARFRNKPYI